MSKMTLKTEGDRYLIVTRRFAASPEAVYRAHTDPKLVQQWLLGPEGWTMPVCINEAKPGGKIRYEWSNGKGGGFYLTGEYLELEPYRRIVHVERMHLPDPTPDNHVETRFEADGTGTLNPPYGPFSNENVCATKPVGTEWTHGPREVGVEFR